MIRQHEYELSKVSIALQVLLTLCCFLGALWGTEKFIHPVGATLKEYKVVFFLIAPLWYVLLDLFKLGRLTRITTYYMLLVEYIKVVGLGMGMLAIAIVMLDFDIISRLVLAIFAVLNLIVMHSYKWTGYRIMKYFRRRGYNTRSVLIIADRDAGYFIDQIINTADWGFRIGAIITDSSHIKTRYGRKYNVMTNHVPLDEIIDKNTIDEVIYCKGNHDQEHIRSLIYTCAEVGVIFRMQSEMLGMKRMNPKLSYFNELPFLTFMNTPGSYIPLKMKSAMDYFFGTLIMLIISPVMFIIALAIKVDDGGPVFFRQERVGLNGRRFQCMKFRTMVTNAEEMREKLAASNEQDGPVFKIKDDPRITKVGKLLRKTSLDELPQFINVLKGDMSIVGPRPPLPCEVEKYSRWQRRRLSMKPGITCIWQVSGRNNIPFDQWMKMDLQYIDSWSLKLDFLLFLKTFKVLLAWDGQ